MSVSLRRTLLGLLLAALVLACDRPGLDRNDASRGEPSRPAGAVATSPDPKAPTRPSPTAAAELALRLSRELIIVDGHVDLPYRLESSSVGGRLSEDVSVSAPAGNFDYPRARAGGLDAPFMSIYVPTTYQTSGGARALADGLIDMVEKLAREHPDKFALAASPDEVRQNSAAGKISLPLGIENGAALEGRVENVAHFRQRGVSYITLTHGKDNDLGDSAYGGVYTHDGLSPLGARVVKEMNRVGIMIDVSHASDATLREVLEQSQVPVIASHSSLRHFVPGFERNLSDALLERLAQGGGVVMVNFGSGFLTPEANAVSAQRLEAAASFAGRHGLDRRKLADRKQIDDHVSKLLPMPYASVEDVANHIDRVKARVGVEHVGLGSDFEGVGDTLARGLEDVSQYPTLLRVLIERGYTREELERICSGNVLRVWQRALDFAAAARPHG